MLLIWIVVYFGSEFCRLRARMLEHLHCGKGAVQLIEWTSILVRASNRISGCSECQMQSNIQVNLDRFFASV